MNERGERGGFIHFGPFEVDLQAGELRRDGRLIKLQEQPFRLLTLLLARPGQIVGRDEIQRTLWPPGIYVDFEHGIGTAVRKLRATLGEEGEVDRYIETVPRRGYRFIAPVEVTATRKREPTLAPASASEAGHPERKPRSQTGRSRVWWIAAAIVLLAAVYLGYRRLRPPPAKASGPIRIAVLPFLNLSGDPSQEYFADGMTEALITELGRSGSLSVISRTSAMHYKGTTKTLPEIAAELNVDMIVEGSVIRSGTKVRVTAQLLDAHQDRHTWASTYDRDQRDIIALQDKLARDITREVGARLMLAGAPRTRPPPSVAPAAFESYLQGRFHYNKRTEADVQTALQCFESATRDDPDFAPAYSGMALCYLRLGDNTMPASEALIPAQNAATRALQLDPNWSQTHSARALLELAGRRWPSAEVEFKTALQLNPADADTNLEYALFLAQSGRLNEATSQFRQAMENDPLSVPLSSAAAIPWYYGRHYHEAIDQYQRALDMDPTYFRAIEGIGVALAVSGDYDAAAHDLERAQKIEDVPEISGYLGYVYARSGKRAQATRLLRVLTERAEARFVSPADILPIPLGLGDKDAAFRLLDQAYEDHSDTLRTLKMDPIFDPICADPRFLDLERRVGLLESGPSPAPPPN